MAFPRLGGKEMLDFADPNSKLKTMLMLIQCLFKGLGGGEGEGWGGI